MIPEESIVTPAPTIAVVAVTIPEALTLVDVRFVIVPFVATKLAIVPKEVSEELTTAFPRVVAERTSVPLIL